MKKNYKIKICVDCYNHVAYVVPIKVPRVILRKPTSNGQYSEFVRRLFYEGRG